MFIDVRIFYMIACCIYHLMGKFANFKNIFISEYLSTGKSTPLIYHHPWKLFSDDWQNIFTKSVCDLRRSSNSLIIVHCIFCVVYDWESDYSGRWMFCQRPLFWYSFSTFICQFFRSLVFLFFLCFCYLLVFWHIASCLLINYSWRHSINELKYYPGKWNKLLTINLPLFCSFRICALCN